ncbi:MAG: hypothetical protein JST19_16570 [Bacteroidetes bacterium]|nr:hypothetical protein [Bacteroidota bacterium]
METAFSLSARSQQFYVLCRHWKSDLEFFRIEAAFLHRLLDDYFVQLLSPESFDKVQQTTQKLFKLEKDENSLHRQLTAHMKQLELAAENVVPEDNEKLADEQATLEALLFKLINEYREVKKEMFALVEGARHKRTLITK